MPIKGWILKNIGQATKHNALYTFINDSGNWTITVFANDKVQAWQMLSRRIEKEKEAIKLRRVGSGLKDSIDDWLMVEV